MLDIKKYNQVIYIKTFYEKTFCRSVWMYIKTGQLDCLEGERMSSVGLGHPVASSLLLGYGKDVLQIE